MEKLEKVVRSKLYGIDYKDIIQEQYIHCEFASDWGFVSYLYGTCGYICEWNGKYRQKLGCRNKWTTCLNALELNCGNILFEFFQNWKWIQ